MSILKDQLIAVANALGRELVNELVFVGGSTVFLYLDDQDSSQLRPTDDVDAIVNVVSRMDWGSLEVRLAAKGFHPSRA